MPRFLVTRKATRGKTLSWRALRAACRERPAHRRAVRSAPHALRCRFNSPRASCSFLQSGHEAVPAPPQPSCRGRHRQRIPRAYRSFLAWRRIRCRRSGSSSRSCAPAFKKLLPASAAARRRQPRQSAVSRTKRVRSSGVARPVASFDPARGIENKATKACGFDGRAGARKTLPRVLCWRSLARTATPGPLGFAACDRPHNPTDEYMKLARWAQLLSDPLELALHLLRLRIKKHVGQTTRLPRASAEARPASGAPPPGRRVAWLVYWPPAGAGTPWQWL